MLQTICRAHSVYFTIYPVSNYTEMQDICRQEFSDPEVWQRLSCMSAPAFRTQCRGPHAEKCRRWDRTTSNTPHGDRCECRLPLPMCRLNGCAKACMLADFIDSACDALVLSKSADGSNGSVGEDLWAMLESFSNSTGL